MTVRKVFIILFVAALLYLPVGPTLDPDMGWHLRTGEYILENGLPRYDVFSFTMPGRAWVAHEWLSDVFMILIYRVAGFPALITVFAAIAALAFLLVYVRCVGRPYLAAFVTLLGALAVAVVWGARPQMFNLLGLAAFVFIVEGVKDQKLDRRAFLLLPILTAIWANLHSGYLVGVALLATYVIGEAAQRRFGVPDERGLDWADIRWLAGMTGMCFLAALLNPHGYRLWIYPFETLTSNAMQVYIQEWHSPDFHQPRFWPFVTMLVIGSISLVRSPKRPSWTDLALFLGTGVAALISARHIPIFAIVTIPVVARYLLGLFADTRLFPLLSGTQRSPQPSRVMVGVHWMAVGLLLLWVVGDITRTIRNNDGAMEGSFPVQAVDFIEKEGWANHRIYNSYGWGGYLIWRGIPVFIDGRADLYGDEFIFNYLQSYLVQPSWREPLDEYAIDYVLIGRATPLSTLLTQADDWYEVYGDEIAQIYERRRGE